MEAETRSFDILSVRIRKRTSDEKSRRRRASLRRKPGSGCLETLQNTWSCPGVDTGSRGVTNLHEIVEKG